MTTDTTQNDTQADTPQGEVFNSFVHITDEAGIHHAFGPGDPIPAWARPLVGEHVITTGFVPEPDHTDSIGDLIAQSRGFTAFADQDDDLGVVEPPAPPPTSGPGSNRAAWAAFAQSVGQATTTDMSRQDIIDALVRNGHITD